MKKILSILSMIIAGSCLTQATYFGNVFGGMDMVAIDDSLWTPQAFDMDNKSYEVRWHSAATSSHLYRDAETLENKLLNAENYSLFAKQIRQEVIKQMMEYGFSGFVARPWQTANDVITFSSGDLQYHMSGAIEQFDDLDEVLSARLLHYKKYFDEYKKFSSYAKFPELEISVDELLAMKDIFLFKDDADLQSLGYEIVAYRERINEDKDYRRYNISTAFANMGNIRIINPGTQYNVMSELHYSPYANDGKKVYQRGYAIVGNSEQLVYAGGLCGVATAVSQGILTNTALDVLEKKAHSIRYRDLYTSYVNGEFINTPGLDTTVYSNQINVRFQNIRNYPIILVMNYDGSDGGRENVFSLAPIEDKGTLSYVGSYSAGGYKCYTREINGENMKNCYKKIVLN